MDEDGSLGSSPGGLTRRSLLKRGAVVGGTLVWAAPVVDSFASPAFGQVGSPDPAACCRFTGGGNLEDPVPSQRMWPLVGAAPARKIATYGFELHCGAVPAVPNRLTVSFDAPDARTVTFHLDGDNSGSHFYAASCSGPPTSSPTAPCSIIDGSGSGRVTGAGATAGAATITFRLRDVSEPGVLGDQVSFTVAYTDRNGTARTFTASGNPKAGGNEQAHRSTGSKSDC